MRRVYYTRTRYPYGSIYGAFCMTCGHDVLIWTWDKRDAKRIGRLHKRAHRDHERDLRRAER